jgi:hypothetical protein
MTKDEKQEDTKPFLDHAKKIDNFYSGNIEEAQGEISDLKTKIDTVKGKKQQKILKEEMQQWNDYLTRLEKLKSELEAQGENITQEVLDDHIRKLTLQQFDNVFGEEERSMWMKSLNNWTNLSALTLEWDSNDRDTDESLSLTNIYTLQNSLDKLLFETNETRATKLDGLGSSNYNNKGAYQSLMDFDGIDDEWMDTLTSEPYEIVVTQLGRDNLPRAFEDEFRDVFQQQWGNVLLDWLDDFEPFRIHHVCAKQALRESPTTHSDMMNKILKLGLKLRQTIKRLDEDEYSNTVTDIQAQLEEIRNTFSKLRTKKFHAKTSVSEQEISEVNLFYNRLKTQAFQTGLVMALVFYREHYQINNTYKWRDTSFRLLNGFNGYWNKNRDKMLHLFGPVEKFHGNYSGTNDNAIGQKRLVSFAHVCPYGGLSPTRYTVFRYLILEIFQHLGRDFQERSLVEKMDEYLTEGRRHWMFENSKKSQHIKINDPNELDSVAYRRKDILEMLKKCYSKEIQKTIFASVASICNETNKKIKSEQTVKEEKDNT